jgi:hypothetical protein
LSTERFCTRPARLTIGRRTFAKITKVSRFEGR